MVRRPYGYVPRSPAPPPPGDGIVYLGTLTAAVLDKLPGGRVSFELAGPRRETGAGPISRANPIQAVDVVRRAELDLRKRGEHDGANACRQYADHLERTGELPTESQWRQRGLLDDAP